MIINGDEIIFEHLSSPSRSTVGEKSQIKASLSFVSSNAKGDLPHVADFTEVETLGKTAAINLRGLFTK